MGISYSDREDFFAKMIMTKQWKPTDLFTSWMSGHKSSISIADLPAASIEKILTSHLNANLKPLGRITKPFFNLIEVPGLLYIANL